MLATAVGSVCIAHVVPPSVVPSRAAPEPVLPTASHTVVDGQTMLLTLSPDGRVYATQVEPSLVVPTMAELEPVLPTASHTLVEGQARSLSAVMSGGRVCVVQVEPPSVVPTATPPEVPEKVDPLVPTASHTVGEAQTIWVIPVPVGRACVLQADPLLVVPSMTEPPDMPAVTSHEVVLAETIRCPDTTPSSGMTLVTPIGRVSVLQFDPPLVVPMMSDPELLVVAATHTEVLGQTRPS